MSSHYLITLIACMSVVGFIFSIAALRISISNDLDGSGDGNTQLCKDGDLVWGQTVRGFNGHSYQIVPVYTSNTGGVFFPDAMRDASLRCYHGQVGYLATVDSEEENAFLKSLMPNMSPDEYFTYSAWLGGTDVAVEGEWRWLGGPEGGTLFWSGDGHTGESGSHYSNWFCNDADDSIAEDDWWTWEADEQTWDFCEPNDFENQDCMFMYGDGSWNDVSCYFGAKAFFVEFDTV